MTDIAFVVEQALGHITHTKNLQANVPRDASVRAHWALIPFAPEGMAARVPVYKTNWTVRAGIRSRKALRDLAQRTALDVLFFHTQVPAVLSQNWMRRIPSVVSLDATPRQYDALGASYGHSAGPSWLENVKWRLNRDCYRTARHLVTWSEWAKGGLVDDYEVAPSRITVISPGVNVQEWRATTSRDARKGAIRILFVGGDFERKGGQLLLRAWRRLRERSAARGGPVVDLHLVTRAQFPAERGLVTHENLAPNSAALKQLYFDSDIFCLPTFGDCLPMVLSEAGASGLPSVSTNVAAIGEITRHGETGLLVSPGDEGALEAALERLVTDRELRLRMGERAVAWVTQHHDAARNTEVLLQVLKRAAGPS